MLGDPLSDRVLDFLHDIEVACRAHGLSISHEDGHGAFIIEEFTEDTLKWLRAAQDETKKGDSQ